MAKQPGVAIFLLLIVFIDERVVLFEPVDQLRSNLTLDVIVFVLVARQNAFELFAGLGFAVLLPTIDVRCKAGEVFF